MPAKNLAGQTFGRLTAKDERITVFLGILSNIVALQRAQSVHPVCIYLKPELYTAISQYMGRDCVDRLFNVPVQANMNDDCLSFIILCEG